MPADTPGKANQPQGQREEIVRKWGRPTPRTSERQGQRRQRSQQFRVIAEETKADLLSASPIPPGSYAENAIAYLMSRLAGRRTGSRSPAAGPDTSRSRRSLASALVKCGENSRRPSRIRVRAWAPAPVMKPHRARSAPQGQEEGVEAPRKPPGPGAGPVGCHSAWK